MLLFSSSATHLSVVEPTSRPILFIFLTLLCAKVMSLGMVVFCCFNHQSADFLTELFGDFISAHIRGVNGFADNDSQVLASEFIIACNAEGNDFCARSLGEEACAGFEAKQELLHRSKVFLGD